MLLEGTNDPLALMGSPSATGGGVYEQFFQSHPEATSAELVAFVLGQVAANLPAGMTQAEFYTLMAQITPSPTASSPVLPGGQAGTNLLPEVSDPLHPLFKKGENENPIYSAQARRVSVWAEQPSTETVNSIRDLYQFTYNKFLEVQVYQSGVVIDRWVDPVSYRNAQDSLLAVVRYSVQTEAAIQTLQGQLNELRVRMTINELFSGFGGPIGVWGNAMLGDIASSLELRIANLKLYKVHLNGLKLGLDDDLRHGTRLLWVSSSRSEYKKYKEPKRTGEGTESRTVYGTRGGLFPDDGDPWTDDWNIVTEDWQAYSIGMMPDDVKALFDGMMSDFRNGGLIP